MTRQIRSVLETIVAPGALLSEEESRRWQTGRRDGASPVVALAPSREEEVAAILARASEEGWPVLPAGSGSWLEGGGPSDVSLVVTTDRMKEMYEYEPADLTFTSGAGVTLAALGEATEPHGQWLPLDPPGGREGTLGATVSLGIGGPLRHLYGTPRDHVLGLTLVSGDGRILRWGGRVVKNVAGFDVTRLTVGSWGSLGVVTSVSARLFPIPEMDVTLAIPGETLETLLPFARVMARSSLPLAAVELLDSLRAEGMPQSDGGWESGSPALALRLLGTRAQVAEMEARILSELAHETATPIRLEGEGSEVLHRNLSGWENGADMVLRLSLLPSELRVLLAEARELKALSEKGGLEADVRVSAHVGTGVLRVAVSGLVRRDSELEPWVPVLAGLRTRLEEGGGTLTLSSGPPPLMNAVGPWGTPGGEEGLLRGLKAEFDPKGILAPGRLGL